MIKLLDKPLKAFTTYALIVLLCSIPVYFVIIDMIWVHEINEHNKIVAKATKENLVRLSLDDQNRSAAIKLWNSLQPETNIREVSSLKPDSTYSSYRKEKPSTLLNFERFQGLVTYFSIHGKFYSLRVESNVEENYETIAAITAITMLFFIILLVGFIQLNKKISQKLWRPFYQTLEKIKAFELSNHLTIDFEESNILEFEELNASINKLVERNVLTFRQQKEFTENASHELQTPLAIVQTKLDLLLQDESISQAQSRIIEETNNALSRVSRINKNLLLLAKIENQQFLEKQSIQMSKPIQAILDLLADLYGGKTMVYTADSECIVEGNMVLVEIMLTNLFMNALRHTTVGTKIIVSLSKDRLVVSNPGIYSLDSEKLFARFSSASIQTPGSGLGLSIVNEICNRYGWKVRYDYVQSMHIFTINFTTTVR